jgi:hypothetical protein
MNGSARLAANDARMAVGRTAGLGPGQPATFQHIEARGGDDPAQDVRIQGIVEGARRASERLWG